MKINSVLIILSFVLLWSCGNNAVTGKSQKFDNGYEYVIHNSAGQDPGEPGYYVEFDLDLIDQNGTVLQSMRSAPQKPQLKIPVTQAEKDQAKGNPLTSLISILGEGDSATVYIPVDSIPRPTPAMEGNDKVGYTVVARRVMSEDDYQKEMEAQQLESKRLMEEGAKIAEQKQIEVEQLISEYKNGALASKTKELPNGLKVITLETGEGENPVAGKRVDVHYYGVLEDGKQFDNSYKRGQPFSFTLGRGEVIQGWDTGIAEINKGAKALLDVPFDLAYGAAGNPPLIPEKARLFFLVELVDIK